ncbi:integrase [Streptomyces sp. NBC_01278]|uniref:integrase n=1 Tax=Streptomyces sp. NBC_01278 TaxID=2903809 RepID=UPI002E36B2D4|nr:integrase [Streptomyces sp. NBC_01278]
MTADGATEADPYMLPMPPPDGPVVLAKWINPGNGHPNSHYQDPIWSMGPLIDNPAAHLTRIFWRNCPPPLRGQLKLITWTMINGLLRPTYLHSRGVQARARTSGGDMYATSIEWMKLARWLHRHRIADLGEVTGDVWRSYINERLAEVSRTTGAIACARLTDLWAFDRLSAAPTGVAQPPWEAEGVDGFLPAAAGGGVENSTEPLDPQVLGPLLVWSIRFVDDFADDILAAWTERRRLTALALATKGTPATWTALEQFLLPLMRGGSLLPATGVRSRPCVARTYIGAVTGASRWQVNQFSAQHGLGDLVARRPGPCPMAVPVQGTLDGKPWRAATDFYEVPELMRHLGTAAAIVCLYLTGMRPQEVLNLRSGCCPDLEPAADGIPGRHLIRSRHFKNVTDLDGHHLSAGEVRAVPWVAITPVVQAIRVLEKMVPEGELLFSSGQRSGVLKSGGLNIRIKDFVSWVNREAATHNLVGQLVPDDPHGPLQVSRFRRTLAWHIARRPGGLVALAIQYGHMRTVLDARTSSRYGARGRGGIHTVLDVETALAAADTAARLRDRLAAGERLSGPAARRALTAAAQAPRFEGSIVPRTFVHKARAYLARDGIVLYDNPEALLICAFKHDVAMCEPAPGATAPRQYDCRPGCANTVRTDGHALLLRERAAELDQLADRLPPPLARRLRTNAARLRATADTHDSTAQSAEALR